MVGGPFVPTVGPELVYPREFFDKLKKIVPDYAILPDYNSRAADPMADYAKKLIRGIEMRETLSLDLMKSEPWQLFTVVFMETDEVQHTFWECMEAPAGTPEAQYNQVIAQIYQRLDQAIGNLILQLEETAAAQDTTIIVLSDHGAGPFRLMINLNHWLSEAGFLHFRQDGNDWVKKVRVRSIKHIAHAYRRYIPPKIRSTLRGLAGAQRFEQAKGAFESALLTDFVDWTRTRAYSLGAGGNIFINLIDREPQGIVSPGIEYEQLREMLIENLLSMRDPVTDEAIVEKVLKREELYVGPHLEQAPDLVIQWSDYGYWGRGQYDVHSPIFENQRHFDFSDQPLTGSHRLDGILIIHGADVESNIRLDGANIVDLAPTILSFLGIAPLESMDGRLLEEVLTPAGKEQIQQRIDAGDVEDASDEYAYDPEMEEKISEHLRSLGYL
jgi:predicted AlkP superfamily phosphohydrolase/phosphomutase